MNMRIKAINNYATKREVYSPTSRGSFTLKRKP